MLQCPRLNEGAAGIVDLPCSGILDIRDAIRLHGRCVHLGVLFCQSYTSAVLPTENGFPGRVLSLMVISQAGWPYGGGSGDDRVRQRGFLAEEALV